jgi:transcriptional regulator with XRE-family HTH domain
MEISIEPRNESDSKTIEGAPGIKIPPFTDEISPAASAKPRARSSLRQRYEAEAKVIERRLGGLEEVRKTLGLSQRKMAQLLLVDPSAWTRWTQGESVPPHIWRALAWYLALQDKYPALDAAFWLQGVARTADSDRIAQNADEIRAQKLHTRSLETRILELKNELELLRNQTPVTPYEERDSHAHERTGPHEDQLRNQPETRAIANFFLALTFAALGFAIASFFSN